MNLNEVYKVHMLGIGGIGMSALARFLHMQGKQGTPTKKLVVGDIGMPAPVEHGRSRR